MGGKLVSAPSALTQFLKQQGKDPSALSPEELLNTAAHLGLINEGQLEYAAEQSDLALEGGPVQAGTGAGGGPMIAIAAVAVVGVAMIAMRSGARPRGRR